MVTADKPGGRVLRFAEHPASSPYQQLGKNPANYAPLTPLSFLERAADVWPTRTAVIHGRWRADYAELRRRCRRLAAALAGRGVRPGDTVAVMLPNVPAMVEAHYGIPMAGAVINALNVRRIPPARQPARARRRQGEPETSFFIDSLLIQRPQP